MLEVKEKKNVIWSFSISMLMSCCFFCDCSSSLSVGPDDANEVTQQKELIAEVVYNKVGIIFGFC